MHGMTLAETLYAVAGGFFGFAIAFSLAWWALKRKRKRADEEWTKAHAKWVEAGNQWDSACKTIHENNAQLAVTRAALYTAINSMGVDPEGNVTANVGKPN